MEEIVYTKRVGHLFEQVRSIQNIKDAIRNAAKRKTERPSVQRILADIDGYALKIQKMLDEETFVPHPYTIREINDGIKRKKRIIAVPRFYPDQCIHHAYVQVFKQVVMHSAHPHSCGCVPKVGTDGAKKLVEKWIRSDPRGTSKILKLDVRQCYPTMPHAKLYEKLKRRIKDKKFLRLSMRLIASYQQAMATGDRLLPESEAVGIPVGLFTSPWFCNFFFSDLDHVISEKTGTAHFVRYVDDMVIFDSNKRRLHNAFCIVRAWLSENSMELKGNWQVFRLLKRPLDFLGYRFHSGYTTLRKSIMIRISRKAKTISGLEYVSPAHAHGMVSYMGYIYHSDSWGFWESHVKPFINLRLLKGVIRNESRKQLKACAG